VEDEIRLIAQRVFRFWDKRMNGDIEFNEFSTGLQRLRTVISLEQKKMFWNIISQDENFIDEEDLVEFLLGEHEDPVLEGFKRMLIGSAENRRVKRLKATLDLDVPNAKGLTARALKRSWSAGYNHPDLKPISTRKSKLTGLELINRVSHPTKIRETRAALPKRQSRRRRRTQSVYAGSTGPTAPVVGKHRSNSLSLETANEVKNNERDDETDEKKWGDKPIKLRLEDSVSCEMPKEVTPKKQWKLDEEDNVEVNIRSRHNTASSAAESLPRFSSVDSYSCSSLSERRSTNPLYLPSQALRKKQLAMWMVVINLLYYPRRERKLRGAGMSYKFAELIRSWAPFDEEKALVVDLDVTDIQYCSASRSVLASSWDGIYRYNCIKECWDVVHKFEVSSTGSEKDIPPSFTVDDNGDIYFHSRTTLYSLPYESETAVRVKPRGKLSRIFTSIQCTGGLWIDAGTQKLYYISNDKVQCIDMRNSVNAVSTVVKLDANGVCIAYDMNRQILYCTDIVGTIYLVEKDTSCPIMKLDGTTRHGIVVDPVFESLLIHNRWHINSLEINFVEPEWNMDNPRLRRITTTQNPGDVLAFDPRSEKVFFVHSRPEKARTIIGILKFL